jgi:hypothetical protein
VFVGIEDYQARFAEKEAAELVAIFIDSRWTPFYQCSRGQVLDCCPEASLAIQ